MCMRFIRFTIPCLVISTAILLILSSFILARIACQGFQENSIAPKVHKYKPTANKSSCKLLDTYKSKFVRIDYTVGCFENRARLRHLVVLYRKPYGKIAMDRFLKYTRDLKNHSVVQMIKKHRVAKPDGYTYTLILYRVLK